MWVGRVADQTAGQRPLSNILAHVDSRKNLKPVRRQNLRILSLLPSALSCRRGVEGLWTLRSWHWHHSERPSLRHTVENMTGKIKLVGATWSSEMRIFLRRKRRRLSDVRERGWLLGADYVQMKSRAGGGSFIFLWHLELRYRLPYPTVPHARSLPILREAPGRWYKR